MMLPRAPAWRARLCRPQGAGSWSEGSRSGGRLTAGTAPGLRHGDPVQLSEAGQLHGRVPDLRQRALPRGTLAQLQKETFAPQPSAVGQSCMQGALCLAPRPQTMDLVTG